MKARSESMPIRLLGLVLTPFVLAWDFGRWVLFGMFAVAERLDPFGPLARFAARVLVPLLAALRPLFERIFARVQRLAVWMLRPVLWVIDRVLPVVRAIGHQLQRAWRVAVIATRPMREGVARAARWVSARWRPVWQQVTRPLRQTRRFLGQVVARSRLHRPDRDL